MDEKLGELDQAREFLLFLSLLEALQVLHQKGFAHRDVNNDNIMLDFSLDSKPRANLIDVGLSNRNKTSFGEDIYRMGKVFRQIVKFGKINNSVLDQLIIRMREPNHKQRISLEDAIIEVKKSYYLSLYEQSKLADLQLPLLLQLHHNKVFASLIPNHSSSPKLADVTASISDPNSDKVLCFSDLNHGLNLFSVLMSFKNSQHRQLGSLLINTFFLALQFANGEETEETKDLNALRQAIVQAIFSYVQKSYKPKSHDRAASERRINNIKTLLSILENSSNKEMLRTAIINWNKTIKRSYLGSELFDLVAKAAGLESKPIVKQYLFWHRSYSESLPVERTEKQHGFKLF